MRNVAIEVFNDPREPWGKEEFESLLRGKSTSYHIHHPFHVMMAEGKLSA
jgi:pyrroloquinoline quinone (PQQ) biosynthesis protein C